MINMIGTITAWLIAGFWLWLLWIALSASVREFFKSGAWRFWIVALVLAFLAIAGTQMHNP